MTAALSVLDDKETDEKQQPKEEDAYASIDGLLTKRLNQTV